MKNKSFLTPASDYFSVFSRFLNLFVALRGYSHDNGAMVMPLLLFNVFCSFLLIVVSLSGMMDCLESEQVRLKPSKAQMLVHSSFVQIYVGKKKSSFPQ